ncbi:MAG: Stage II sporulation E family protein [Thermotoga sp. 47_83]|uniref:Stage II sporulation E family protein n=1 Tax=Thermotoga petrophila TaxID=93929 RepID=A0A101EQL9_9THEM|nr:MAG: Stage II sporulation E family protein [Thermotoga petrophila]KUK33454.1 MAG: Stage II sporulation E family protein [Thermotoga sp. 47_83]HAA82983.1 hypothetical protein [Thermotoga petrophila]HBU00299.1 hypothetical protein [Thermotoga petrophila]
MNEREICERIAEILNLEHDCSKGIDDLLKILEYEINEYRKSLEEQAMFMEAQIEELSRSNEEISTLLEISEIFGTFEFPLNLQNKLEKVIRLLRNVIKFEGYVVHLEGELTAGDLNREEIEAEIGNPEKTVLIEPGKSEKFSNLLFVPIKGNRYYGYMCFTGKEDGGVFTAGDRKIAEMTARYIASALDRLDFLKKEIERERLEEQLNIARQIQTNLLPRKIPEIGFVEADACSQPAVQVGGDYYDFFVSQEKRFLTVVGDVAGKSVPAALLMSAVRSYVKVLVTTCPDLERLVNRLNSILCEDMTNDRFVTMAFIEISPDGTLNLINAGHNPVYFLHKGELVKIEASAIPIGITEWEYRKHTIHLKPDTFVISYSDGLTEARNEAGEEFGYEKLENILREFKGETPAELLEALRKNVKSFMGDAQQHDDMTIVVLKYKGQQEVE